MVQTGFVSKDQLERARRIPALDYILSYEGENVKRVGSEYRLRDHESLAVGDKGFYWHSMGIGGKTALDYLTDVRGYGLVDAVCLLLNEQPQGRESPERHGRTARPGNQNAEPRLERQPFAIPRHNKNNRRVIAYLQSRGIDKGLILDCIERGDLYESVYYHNCVFKGKDETGKTRYAAIRSITSAYKGDAEGSDKKYCFLLPPDNPYSSAAAAFESPIDALSHQSMCLHGYIPQFDGWRLSLGGTSVAGLAHFLGRYPQISHCLVCTDVDEAGDKAAARISEMTGIKIERVTPPIGVDWNDALLALQKAERTQNRARSSARKERG